MDIKVRRGSASESSPQNKNKVDQEPPTAPFIDPTPEKPAFKDEEPLTPIPPTKPKRKFHIWPQKWSKKKKRLATAGLIILLLALLGGGYYWYQKNQKPKEETKAVVAEEAPKPTTEASRLTGVQIEPAENQRAVTGVMIENSPDARPQSGLSSAGIVFEAVAEGGITRFLALYLEGKPTSIGPIRSARPYYLDWLLPFDASYAHAGGSPQALNEIKALKVKDMDQFANAGAYERSAKRYAPHNLYSSMDKLYGLAQSKGYTTSTFTSLTRKEKEAPIAVPTAKVIDLNISSYLYNVHYDYDVASNTYHRSQGGKPHTEDGGGQLTPKVVIAVMMPRGIASDGTHTNYTTTGSGSILVFQDGGVVAGTWKKDSRTSQFVFSDSAGQPLALNPGQTWISMVNASSDVIYKP